MQANNFVEEQSAIERELKEQERLESLRTYEGEDRVVKAPDAEKTFFKGSEWVVKTKIPTLDATTEGFREGELVVVSGPTKNGKTSVCQTLSVNFAQEGVKSVWFPFEGGYKEFFRKYPRIESVEDLDFYVPLKPKDHSLQWVEQRIVEAKLKWGVKVVFIDNLDFLYDDSATLSQKRESNFATYVGGIVKRLKEIAMEQEVVMFLMVHLAKAKWTKMSLPDSSDIRDSSRIPQLSDFVIMVMREKDADHLYTENTLVRVVENRYNGKTEQLTLLYQNNLFMEKEIIHDDIPWHMKP